MAIEYAGRDDWKIVSAKSDLPYLSTDIKEISRGDGNVKYVLTVHLKEGAPTGYLKDELTLKTNDSRTPTFPVAVEGRVVASLAISPSSLMLGILQPGQKVTKKVIVTGKKPFRVTGVDCDNPSFKLTSNTPEAKWAHVVEVTFTAGNQPGKVSERIHIHTDNPTHPDAELPAYGQITSPLAGT